MADPVNIRVLVPRVRRAVEGAGAPPVLTDEAIKDLTADALANILLYTGSVFGKTLEVTDTDPDTHAPSEYATSAELSLTESTVVAAQAALDHFFFRFAGAKTSERIGDEAGTWEWTISASLLTKQLDFLVSERDRALATLEEAGAMDRYESFLAIRDSATSQLIEPWVDAPGIGGQGLYLGAGGAVLEPDFRFGGV